MNTTIGEHPQTEPTPNGWDRLRGFMLGLGFKEVADKKYKYYIDHDNKEYVDCWDFTRDINGRFWAMRGRNQNNPDPKTNGIFLQEKEIKNLDNYNMVIKYLDGKYEEAAPNQAAKQGKEPQDTPSMDAQPIIDNLDIKSYLHSIDQKLDETNRLLKEIAAKR